jgi:hypothetical protein
MNKRIEQLAGQLGPVATIGNWGRVEWADNVYPQLGDKMYAAVDLEKFAELIVQECIVQIQLTTARDPQTSVQYRQSVGHIHRIRQHFGIE